MSRSVGFFIFFSLQVLQHILDLGKQEHREGEKRDPRRHWSSIRPSLVRWCRSALGGDGRSSGRRRVAGDVDVDDGPVQGRRTSHLVCRATNPTSLFYMALRDGGPPAVLGWASPIKTRVKGPVGRWANWWRSIQHSPP